MQVEAANVLVTGSNRGLGRALVQAALDHGAARVYATARDPGSVGLDDARVTTVQLDLTDDRSVERAGELCRDTDILINNAAYLANSSALRAQDLDAGRLEMETNYFGLVRITRVFAPHLAARGGGAIANILSIGALACVPFCSSYCAAKSAAWSFTQGSRAELAAQRTEVIAVFPGPIATDMARPHQQEGRCPPGVMADAIMAAISRGERMIFPDRASAAVAEEYGRSPWALANRFAGNID